MKRLSENCGARRLGLMVSSIAFLSTTALFAAAPVVINEVMYHPPDDRDDLQFIELLNPGAKPVDLTGWSISKGVDFKFPPGSTLAGGSHAVICRDQNAFASRYGMDIQPVGIFTGKLSHNGERIELTDSAGRAVETFKYSDKPPWPLGADGYGSSLERIHPDSPAGDPANWASSTTRLHPQVRGTPGNPNSTFSKVPLPLVSEVKSEKPEPDRPVTITATVADPTGIDAVTLSWTATAGQPISSWTDVSMKRLSGDPSQGTYSAPIPGQPEGRLIRYTIRVLSTSGAERVAPHPNEPRSSYSFSTFVNRNNSQVPFLQILTLGAVEPPNQRFRRPRQPGEFVVQRPTMGGGAIVYSPPGGTEVFTFDHVRVIHRQGGWKAHFLKDQLFDGMSAINLIFEGSPRYVLSEPLAYELYRRAGVPAPLTQHVRLWVDQRPHAYFLMVEQPNKAFLKRNERDEDGDLYKAVWYGQGVVGQHEKKTNPHTGHNDLVNLVEGLQRTAGAEQWEFIQQHFNVDEVASYYAVNMCIQNWDGFFNNHYVYHAPGRTGRWEIFPWDEDKTWGDHDGASSRYDWYEMPLTFGSHLTRPPSRSFFGGGPFGGNAMWWRPPGWLSGPLLSNPQFRARFLARLREICDSIFTIEKFEPFINRLENRLVQEVPIRAQMFGQNTDSALRSFHSDIDSFRRQVANRRQYILTELEQSR